MHKSTESCFTKLNCWILAYQKRVATVTWRWASGGPSPFPWLTGKAIYSTFLPLRYSKKERGIEGRRKKFCGRGDGEKSTVWWSPCVSIYKPDIIHTEIPKMVLVRKQTRAKSAGHSVVRAQEQGFETRFVCVYRVDSPPSSTMS